MISAMTVNIFIISLMLSIPLILILIITILRCHLSKQNKRFKKHYTALLMNSNEIIERMIPINKQQQQQKSMEQFSIPIQTETLYPCVEANEDYYQSILSIHDTPCFTVRETIFKKYPRSTFQTIIDLKKGNYSNNNQI
jgi:hypothetical protein